MSEPLGRALARAGWCLLAVLLVEALSRLPMTTFVWGSGAYTLPFKEFIIQFFSTHFPPPSLTPGAATTLALSTLSYASVLVCTLLCLVIVRYLTGSGVPMGHVRLEVIYWIIAAIALDYLLRIAIRVPDYLAGSIVAGDFLRAACRSIKIGFDETNSEALFLYSLLLPIAIAPFCEEVLYRGVLVKGFLPALGLLPTAVLTSALFSLSHFGQSPDLGLYISLFLTGLGLFAARIRFAGIGVPIALHLTLNAVLVFEALIRCS